MICRYHYKLIGRNVVNLMWICARACTQDLKCFRHSMQTASEASSPMLDGSAARPANTTSASHTDAANSVHDAEPPPSAVASSVPLAVLEEFNAGVTDTEDAPCPAGETSAQCRRSQFSGSRRSKRPLATSNGPVASPPPAAPSGPGPPVDAAAVIVDMNSNDKDAAKVDKSPTSRYDGWDRTLDDDNDDDDIGNYDADDAMVEFAERYFNAHPAQFSQSALARTVNIVTRKSLNVSSVVQPMLPLMPMI